MKKSFLILTAIIGIVVPVWSQDKLVTQFPYTEGWEESSTLWYLSDMDGDTNYSLSYSLMWPCHSGSCGLRSSSLQNAPCDHWVISPRLAIPSDQFLIEWWCCNQTYPGRTMEHFDVLVSRAGYDTADFDTVIFSYTFPDESDPFRTGLPGDFIRMTADLGAFAGDTIHVAFRHHQRHGYWLLLDDITVIDGALLVYGMEGPDQVSVGEMARYSMSSPTPERFIYDWEINGSPVLEPDTGRSIRIEWDSDYPRGHYLLQCHITNRISGDTGTISKDIFFHNCEHSISDFPYFEDFSDPTCWTLYEQDVPYGMERHYGIAQGVIILGDPFTEEGSRVPCLYSIQGHGSSSWAVSPEIELNQPDLEVYWKGSDYSSSPSRVVLAYTLSELGDTVDEDQFVALCDTVLFTNTLQSISVSLPSELEGQVFRLAFFHKVESEQNSSTVIITDFEIAPSRAPVIDSIYGSRIVSVGAEMNYWADVSSGESPSYHWIVEGDSVQPRDSSTAVVVWTRPGLFRVTLEVDNRWGSVFDTFYVEVTDCGVWEAPFQAVFEQELPCWTQRNLSNDRSGWELETWAVSSESHGSATDHWLISPAIHIPEEGEYEFVSHVTLSFQGGLGTVLLSTSGPRIDSFSDTLVRFTSSLALSSSLSRYRGDTVWVAFRHQHQGEGYSGFFISDAMVADSALPRVRLRLNRHPVAGCPDTIVAVRENPGVAVDGYEWRLDGRLIPNETDSVLIYPFPQGVSYIAVTACNAAGCGSAADSVMAYTDLHIQQPDPVSATLAPNPAHDRVTVASSFGLRSVSLYDMQGTRVLYKKLSGYAETVDLSQLPSGLYVVMIATPAGPVTKMLAKE